MPYAVADDGVKLYYEEAGSGLPIVFAHEFAGDYRSYEPQLRYFARGYRCIAYNARGFPPSDVPADLEKYTQARSRDDIRDLLDQLGIDQAHVVGVSMGSFATLHFGLRYPGRARSLVLVGCGSGAPPDRRAQFQQEAEASAALFESRIEEAAGAMAIGPARVQFQNKDPRGWAEFRSIIEDHSPLGAALTLRGIQKRRPSLYDLADDLRKLTVPVLVISGDEDDACVEPSIMLKRTIPTAGLAIMPRTGHMVNIEEPALFNQLCGDFFHQVELGRWPKRDPRSATGRIF